jgi:tyrosinase
MAIRKAIRGLSTQDLTKFRNAVSRQKASSDERGYNHYAGLHSLPLPTECQHGTLLFLPWHRAYLYFWERALQDRVSGVGIPYWDWTAEVSHQRGLPGTHTQRRVNDEENPLFASTVEWRRNLIDQVRNQLPGTLTREGRTLRDPDPPDELPREETIDDILSAPTFADFSNRLENVHGAVHGWVGGAMSQVATAGYDPIFISHHSMVDRLWYLYQLRFPGRTPPASMMQTALPPFPMTVAQTLDIRALGYEYAVQIVQ